jgi:hypothetical protein
MNSVIRPLTQEIVGRINALKTVKRNNALSLGVKRPGREADHSTPSSAEVKECVGLYLHSPNNPSWRGA